MAGGQERLLRRRIRSVEATKKITRAMELIAASQIARARARIAGSRPYVEGIEKVLAVTAAEATRATRVVGEPEHVDNALVVAVVGDRGLSGAYNSSVLRATERLITAGASDQRSYRVVTVGRKAISYFRHRAIEPAASFVQMSDRPSFADARRVAAEVITPFLEGEVDLVELISTRFVSAGTQVVERRQVLPLSPPDPAQRGERPAEPAPSEAPQPQGFYDFEPSPEELLSLLVPQYAEAVLYLALLEASASEHTARQRAMAAATENAEELITTLRRVMNRARQDSITTEITEIVSGAEALRKSSQPTVDLPFDDNHEEQTA